MAWDIAKLTAWEPTHMEEAAAWAASLAPQLVEHHEYHRDRLSTMETWSGNAHEGAWESASWAANTAIHAAYPMASGAAQLTQIAGDALGMRQMVLEEIALATSNGLVVSPDLKQVTGPPGTQELAEQHAAMIKHYLGQFQNVLDEGARRIQTHSAELQQTGFPDTATSLMTGYSDDHVKMGTDLQGQPQIQMGGQPIGGGLGASMMSGGFKQDPIISNPKEPDKPNPIVGSAPQVSPPSTKDKSEGRQVLDALEDVGEGTALTITGTVGVMGGLGGEIPSGGLSTTAVIAGIAGIGGGIKKLEDGLDEALHLGNG